MEKKVIIRDKEYTVKEIPYIEAIDINPDDKKGTVIKMFKASVGLTEEEISKLTIKQGKEIETVIAEVNGIDLDFQDPTEKKESGQN